MKTSKIEPKRQREETAASKEHGQTNRKKIPSRQGKQPLLRFLSRFIQCKSHPKKKSSRSLMELARTGDLLLRRVNEYTDNLGDGLICADEVLRGITSSCDGQFFPKSRHVEPWNRIGIVVEVDVGDGGGLEKYVMSCDIVGVDLLKLSAVLEECIAERRNCALRSLHLEPSNTRFISSVGSMAERAMKRKLLWSSYSSIGRALPVKGKDTVGNIAKSLLSYSISLAPAKSEGQVSDSSSKNIFTGLVSSQLEGPLADPRGGDNCRSSSELPTHGLNDSTPKTTTNYANMITASGGSMQRTNDTGLLTVNGVSRDNRPVKPDIAVIERRAGALEETEVSAGSVGGFDLPSDSDLLPPPLTAGVDGTNNVSAKSAKSSQKLAGRKKKNKENKKEKWGGKMAEKDAELEALYQAELRKEEEQCEAEDKLFLSDLIRRVRLSCLQQSEEAILNAATVFSQLDLRREGFLENDFAKDTMYRLADEKGLSKGFERAFEMMDKNDDGKISLDEFVAAYKCLQVKEVPLEVDTVNVSNAMFIQRLLVRTGLVPDLPIEEQMKVVTATSFSTHAQIPLTEKLTTEEMIFTDSRKMPSVFGGRDIFHKEVFLRLEKPFSVYDFIL